jgi:hypothetical protein
MFQYRWLFINNANYYSPVKVNENQMKFSSVKFLKTGIQTFTMKVNQDSPT